jgi:hypothetical protein
MEPEAVVRDLYDAFNERDFERVAAAFCRPVRVGVDRFGLRDAHRRRCG